MKAEKLTITLKSLFLLIIGIFLILTVGFRPLEYFRDTDNYLNMIRNFDSIWQCEPTFWLINQFNQLLLGGHEQIIFFDLCFFRS